MNFKIICSICSCTLFSIFILQSIHAQTYFERNTDFNQWLPFTSNNNAFSGAAWGDVNGDGFPDIIISSNRLFINNGDGTFTPDFNAGLGNGFTSFVSSVVGVTMADIDNDDDLDVFINSSKPFATAQNQDAMYINNGNGQFERDTFGPWNPVEVSWGSAFGDFNGDEYIDLVTAHAANFLGPALLRPSSFFINTDGSTAGFQKDFTYSFTNNLAPYTVPYWSDYDMDGDQDLFIASGPGGAPGIDSIYTNTTIENGVPGFETNGEAFAGVNQDGQCYNFIDYDNDGDKDLFLTNWTGASNRFYKNNGGIFEEIQMPFSYNNSTLTNAWGDIDNDGDLDVLITNFTNGNLELWINEIDTFSLVADEFCNQFGNSGLFLADVENDGRLDFYTTGTARAGAIYQNIFDEGNHWMQMKLVGTESNRAAIGANMTIWSNINGVQTAQMREVSAQNAFQGHHDLRVHVGLGDAMMVDSLLVVWPSGNKEKHFNLDVDQIYELMEGDGISVSVNDPKDHINLAKRFKIYPNPTEDSLSIEYDGNHSEGNDSPIQINNVSVYDRQGKLHLSTKWGASIMKHELDVHELSAGQYYIIMRTDKGKLVNVPFQKM